MNDDVLIGVDPHKASNTLAVMDPVSRSVIEASRFENTSEGYKDLKTFVRRWSKRRFAVEGCHGAGRSLSQRLVADGEVVLDVPPKLAARVRVFSQGHGRKTDRDDTISIGLVALDGVGVQRVHSMTPRSACDCCVTDRGARGTAHPSRVPSAPSPGRAHTWRGAPRADASSASAVLVRLRPKDAVCRIRRQLAVGHVSDIRALDRKIKAVRSQIAELVEASGTTLVDLFGIGPVIAGRILAEVGDINRFATKDRFATYNGTAPIDVSSGDQVRHRLSRSGNRHINHALHMMAVTQIRNPKSEGRAYYERKRLEGKTGKEALRCLKRRLSDVVYRQLLADEQGRIARCGSPTTQRPTPPTSTSPTSRYRAVTPRREPKPPGVEAWIALDWRAERLIGIEVLDANAFLPADLLEEAQNIH